MNISEFKYKYDDFEDNNSIVNHYFQNYSKDCKIKKIYFKFYNKKVIGNFNLISTMIFLNTRNINNNQLNKIFHDLKKNFKSNNYINSYKSITRIEIKRSIRFEFEELIFFLEQIEEIQPIGILIKMLSLHGGNPLNYPKILKNRKKYDLININLNILSKLDKSFHDNFINQLNNKQIFLILEHNKLINFDYKYNLLKNLNSENIDITDINKLIKIIDILIKSNNNYDKIYNETNIYYKYLNHLSTEDLFKILDNEKIRFSRAYEIINYLYTQENLTKELNIKLVTLINEKYKHEDLSILKNKILCKLITNNTNFDNEIFNELSKFENTIEGLIKIITKEK